TNYNGTVIEARTHTGLRSGYDAAHWKPRVSVLRLEGGAYQNVATLAPSPFAPTDFNRRSFFGTQIAVSRDGGYVAVVDINDAIAVLVTPPPTSSGEDIPPRGAVYLFEKRKETY